MKILLSSTGYLPVPPVSAGPLVGGSVELHTYYLANELAKLGNDVHYVTNVTENASFSEGVTLHQLPDVPFDTKGGYSQTAINFAFGGSLTFAKTLSALSKQHYDIIHGHGNIPTGLLVGLGKKSGTVFTAHNRTPWMLQSSSSLKQALRKAIFRALDFRIINNVDCVIAVSEILKKELVDRFGLNSKVVAIQNGVDINIFKPSEPDSSYIKNAYGVEGDYIIFVGRLVEEKAVDTLIKAIAGTTMHAVIVGTGSLLPYLKELSRNVGVDKQVHFLGLVSKDKLPELYAQATLFALPSVAEGGSPHAALEAMASGLPIVASSASGMDGILTDSENGFIIDPNDTNQFREKLLQIFDDKQLRKTMGERSRKIAEEQCSWAQVARKTLRLYEKIV